MKDYSRMYEKISISFTYHQLSFSLFFIRHNFIWLLKLLIGSLKKKHFNIFIIEIRYILVFPYKTYFTLVIYIIWIENDWKMKSKHRKAVLVYKRRSFDIKSIYYRLCIYVLPQICLDLPLLYSFELLKLFFKVFIFVIHFSWYRVI